MKALKTFLMSLSLLLLLSSCSWFTKEVIVYEKEYVYVAATIPLVEHPAPLNLSDIDFDVVSYKNLDQFLAENEKRNGVVVFVALDIREYEAISTNTAEMRRYLEQQMGIIEFYENAIRQARESEAKANNVSETE